MSFHAYTALWLSYGGDRVLLPTPLIVRTALQTPVLRADQLVTPSPLIVRTALQTPLLLITSPFVFTPSPLIFRTALQNPLLLSTTVSVLSPDPLIFRTALPAPALLAGDAILTPEPLYISVKMATPAALLGDLYPPLLIVAPPFITKTLYRAFLTSDAGILEVPIQSANATLRPALVTPTSVQVPASVKPSLAREFESAVTIHMETDQPTTLTQMNKGTWRYHNPLIPLTSLSEQSYTRTQGATNSRVQRYFNRQERGNSVVTDERIETQNIDAQGHSTQAVLQTHTNTSSYRRTQISGPITIRYTVSSQFQHRSGTESTGAAINVTTTDRSYRNSWSQDIPLGGQVPVSPVPPPPIDEQNEELSKIPSSNRNDATIVIPAIASILGAITDQLAGGHPQMMVSRLSVLSTGDAISEVLFAMAVTGWQLSRSAGSGQGATSAKDTMTLRGQGVSPTSKAETLALEKVLDWQKDSVGSYQIRAPIDPVVQPGDMVIYEPDALAVVVREIAYAISVQNASMTIQGR